MEKRSLEVSWTSLWRIFFFGLFVLLLFLSRDIIIGLFLAIIISSALEVPISFLERRGLPRTIGVILVFLVLILAVIILFYAVTPLIIVNLNSAFFEIQKAAGTAWWREFFNFRAIQSINDLMNRLVNQFIPASDSLLGLFSQVLGGLSLTISVFILSFYLCLSRHGVERFIRAVFPTDYEESVLRIYQQSKHKIGLWFRTQIILSFIMGILVWLSLSLLGVSYAPLLGLTAGLLEIVPFVGPIIAGAASVLTALGESTILAIYTLVVFLALQQFESNIMVPFLTRRTVGLHPIIVIVALLIGIELSGFLGALIAVPAAAVFQEVVEEWSDKKKTYSPPEA